MTLICSIGSTDPWNAAGLGADLRTIAAMGARSVWIVAGITAQDAGGLRGSAAVTSALIDAQFTALADAPIDAYRVGALLDEASIQAVAHRLRGAAAPVVYDPALGPSAGGCFVDAAMHARICNELLATATVVTPNLREAAYFSGGSVDDVASMRAAGSALLALGAQAALIKGGHLRGKAVDVLVDADGVELFEDDRLAGDMRGTGCVLAAALSVELGRGRALRPAIAAARTIVRHAIAHAVTLGGMRVAP